MINAILLPAQFVNSRSGLYYKVHITSLSKLVHVTTFVELINLVQNHSMTKLF